MLIILIFYNYLGCLGSHHNIIFWALNDLAMQAIDDARGIFIMNVKKMHILMTFVNIVIGQPFQSEVIYREAFELLKYVYELLNYQLPAVHHEKVIYLGKLFKSFTTN